MAITCDPAALVAAAKCFNCIPKQMQKPVELYLLAVAAGGSLDPKVIEAAAAPFRAIPRQMQEVVEQYLLCKIAGG
jgi:hypothetical protein